MSRESKAAQEAAEREQRKTEADEKAKADKEAREKVRLEAEATKRTEQEFQIMAAIAVAAPPIAAGAAKLATAARKLHDQFDLLEFDDIRMALEAAVEPLAKQRAAEDAELKAKEANEDAKKKSEVAAAAKAALEGKVVVNVPKRFSLRRKDNTVVHYPAGPQKMPKEDAEHSYSKAHGVEIVGRAD